MKAYFSFPYLTMRIAFAVLHPSILPEIFCKQFGASLFMIHVFLLCISNKHLEKLRQKTDGKIFYSKKKKKKKIS